jgi:enoyl-CoA hydratase
MSNNTLFFDINEGVGHVVMNQPPANQMTIEFFMELGVLVSEMKKRDDIKAIVISGEGRHFSSGASIEELLGLMDDSTTKNNPQSDGGIIEFLTKNQENFLFFEKAGVPVISAIRGVCLGSAFELALFSHFRFCGEDAVLGLPETTYNLLPGIAGTSGITALAGKPLAMELVLKGNTFTASDALKMNLIDGIFPKKQVVASAIGFAKLIMNNYQKERKNLYLKRFFNNKYT